MIVHASFAVSANESNSRSCGEIVPSSTNPRRDFSGESLAELVASIEAQGVLEPVLVRPAAHLGFELLAGERRWRGFELVAGERRWRAAQAAGLEKIPAMVRDYDDDQAMLVQLAENYQRQDLDPIAEAEGFARACRPVAEGGAGYTQTALARALGCSQGQVANRLRLLELPEPWRGRVMSRDISPSHARLLLPWRHEAAILAAVEADCQTWEEPKAFAAPSLHAFESVIRDAIHGNAAALSGVIYASGELQEFRADLEALDPAVRESLRVVELCDDAGCVERFALNVELGERLMAETRAAALDGADGRSEGGRSENRGLAPSEKKAAAKARAEQLARRIGEWRIDWLRLLCWRALPAACRERPMLSTRLCVYFLCETTEAWRTDRVELLAAAIKAAGIIAAARPPRGAGPARADAKGRRARLAIYCRLSEIDAATIGKVAARLVGSWLVDAEGNPSPCMPPADVERLAADLGIDLEAAWRDEGEFKRRFLELFTREELPALAKEMGATIAPELAKSAMIGALLAPEKNLRVPKCLRKAGKK